jgi:hypothetical protein
MTSVREELRLVIAKYGLPTVYAELQAEMRETYTFLRQIYEPPRNNLVIPVVETIPDRIVTPHHKAISSVIQDPPEFVLSEDVPTAVPIVHVEKQDQEETSDAPVEPGLKDVVIQARSEMAKQGQAPGEKFSKAKHREEVAKKYKELSDKGIKPESLLTKENLTNWLGQGMSYMRIARECTGVNENEIAAIAKTFGLQSDIKKYIVMKKGAK